MLKVILPVRKFVTPFNEPARELSILNKALWLHQNEVLEPYITKQITAEPGTPLPQTAEPCLVYRDNLFFDAEYLSVFLNIAKRRRIASRAAFLVDDPCFREQCLPLSNSFTRVGGYYLADLWYYPYGPTSQVEPLSVNPKSREYEYFQVPPLASHANPKLRWFVPSRRFMAIDHWVHLFLADIVFGLLGLNPGLQRADKQENLIQPRTHSSSLWGLFSETKPASGVLMGQGCKIDPTAVVRGPTVIGNDVSIGPGAVIDHCLIGDHVTISQGCQLKLSVLGNGTFLPFRASLFLTSIMDNSMVGQNSSLQLAVVGRDTYIGAGNTFVDLDVLSGPVRVGNGQGGMQDSQQPVLGACIGHHCRIGSGLLVQPGRTIESDVVLMSTREKRVIDRDVLYEDSDHHQLPGGSDTVRIYPRQMEPEQQE